MNETWRHSHALCGIFSDYTHYTHISATALGEDFVALPKTGDKVTLSAEYWDSCCNEAYDASVAGPLRLGDVGEVGGRNVYMCIYVCVCVCVCHV